MVWPLCSSRAGARSSPRRSMRALTLITSAPPSARNTDTPTYVEQATRMGVCVRPTYRSTPGSPMVAAAQGRGATFVAGDFRWQSQNQTFGRCTWLEGTPMDFLFRLQQIAAKQVPSSNAIVEMVKRLIDAERRMSMTIAEVKRTGFRILQSSRSRTRSARSATPTRSWSASSWRIWRTRRAEASARGASCRCRRGFARIVD